MWRRKSRLSGAMSADGPFLMCPPRFYGVDYVINAWMDGNVGRADRGVAQRQWDKLHAALAARASIELVEPIATLPDMAFSANAGLVCHDLFIPARFRFVERQPEVAYYVEWARRRGLRVVDLPGEPTFEGEGDALFQPGEALLWGGYGVRTSLRAFEPLAEIVDAEIVPLRLVDERFYHLDTCFCPLPGGRLVYHPEAFDAASLATITARFAPSDRFEVGSHDALSFACNAICVGSTVITNFAGEALRRCLESWGFEALALPLDEFILAGGAAKCLALRLTNRPVALGRPQRTAGAGVREREIDIRGHLLDRGLMNQVLDEITRGGGSFEVEALQAGLRHDQTSTARVRVIAPSADSLDAVLGRLVQLGAHIADDKDARVEKVLQDGVAPEGFYGTTIFPTDVRLDGRWRRAGQQRMDATFVVDGESDATKVECRLIRELRAGERVVCGIEGIRVHRSKPGGAREAFRFMSATASSERRVELAVERIAWEMLRIRERGGRIVVVAGPVVVHTGGAPHLAKLIERGCVQALLGGNGLAAHDIEAAIFGTSLGIDLQRGIPIPGGHQHHLKAINRVRACGSIARAVEEGVVRAGILYECVRHGVPFALAGSIRDDGPLPDTLMDLIEAQRAYARLLAGAEMIVMLASMLHAIGVGNMTPAGVRLICVDISPAVVTKLADRGSLESTGIVTDVGLFLNLLEQATAEV